MPHDRGRVAIGTVAGLGLSGCFALITHGQIATLGAAPTPADVIAVAIVGLGAVLAAWHGLTYAALLALRRVQRGRLRRSPEAERNGVAAHPRFAERCLRAVLLRWGFPVARRAILGAAMAGTGASLTVLPAHATPEVDEDLSWTAMVTETAADNHQAVAANHTSDPADEPVEDLSDQPANDLAPPGTDHASSEETAGPSSRATHDVQPGESLWSIAATHLGDDAGEAEIAAAWPQWYAENRAAIGDDPDLIHPGLVLDKPAVNPEEHA